MRAGVFMLRSPCGPRVLTVDMEVGLIIAIGFAVAFALTNGFHDASNAIATLVATRGATPGQAVALSATFNMAGAILLGTAWALHSTWRLYRWARGRELRCACGGMMSRVRYNRQRQKYRKCLACGGKTLEGAHCGGT